MATELRRNRPRLWPWIDERKPKPACQESPPHRPERCSPQLRGVSSLRMVSCPSKMITVGVYEYKRILKFHLMIAQGRGRKKKIISKWH